MGSQIWDTMFEDMNLFLFEDHWCIISKTDYSLTKTLYKSGVLTQAGFIFHLNLTHFFKAVTMNDSLKNSKESTLSKVKKIVNEDVVRNLKC